MDLGLRGRRALVMGGTKGLGRSIADALAGEGAAIVVSGRSQDSTSAAADALLTLGASAAHGVPADVANATDMDHLADKAVHLLGGVDILILNHGGPPPGMALDLTEEALTTWFQRMVVAPIRIANRLLPAMRERKWGRIIAVGSSGMVQPIPNLALSTVLRGGIVGWCKALSQEVAADGVTVNILAPGTIRTGRIIETVTANAKRQGISVDEMEKRAAAEAPAGRMGEPDEYGPMGAFLASDKASYVTGTLVRVDGGRVRGLF